MKRALPFSTDDDPKASRLKEHNEQITLLVQHGSQESLFKTLGQCPLCSLTSLRETNQRLTCTTCRYVVDIGFDGINLHTAKTILLKILSDHGLHCQATPLLNVKHLLGDGDSLLMAECTHCGLFEVAL